MQTPTRLNPHYENLHFERVDNNMIINFGPQHPGAHGRLRLMRALDGEKSFTATPAIG